MLLPSATAKASSLLPGRGLSFRPPGLTGSPSRLSRMTIQDTVTDHEADELSFDQPVADSAEAQPGSSIQRTASRAETQTGMGGVGNPKLGAAGKVGLELQLAGPGRSSRDVSSMRSSQDPLVSNPVSSESTAAAVPAWESNSAAAWVKQKSLEKSQSTAAQVAGWAREEEEQQLNEVAGNSPVKAATGGPGLGKGRALGGLHIELEEQPPQDGLQEWTESGLDDIAAAVLQYTGASPTELLTTTDDPQDQQQSPRQQQQQQRPQITVLRTASPRLSTQSPKKASAGKAYATQQDEMDAELDAAMAADRDASAAPKYANAQEQMEAELEAAMAADSGVAAAGAGAPVYANAQEQMEAELEAAMAADAAADARQDVQGGNENASQHADQWQQMEIDAAAAADDVITGTS